MNTTLLHPMVVHFPIALLIIGAMASVLSRIFSKHRLSEKLHVFASFSIIVGAASAAAAILSGYLFTKNMIGIMGELRDTHIMLALISVACGVISAVLMALSLCPKNQKSTLIQTLAMICSLVTATMIGITGHYGGMMVFGA